MKKGYKIGNVSIENNVILAPMAGVSNQAYRLMCKAFGAGMLTTEMISDKGIFYNDAKTKEIARINQAEHPIAVQIFGADIDTLVNAAIWVEKNTDADILDINMGCPVNKIVKENSGSAYLKDENRIFQTVKEVVNATSLPVSVKVRIGFDHNNINIENVCNKIIEAGAKAIVIHGRCRSDMYSGEVRYDLIKKVKEEHPDFVIIANGDISDPIKAKEILEYTKADGIMIGRASYGNFEIFEQINYYLENGELLFEKSLQEKLALLRVYAENLINLKGEIIACKELRAQAPWFIKGINQGATYRRKLSMISTFAELLNILSEIREKYLDCSEIEFENLYLETRKMIADRLFK